MEAAIKGISSNGMGVYFFYCTGSLILKFQRLNPEFLPLTHQGRVFSNRGEMMEINGSTLIKFIRGIEKMLPRPNFNLAYAR
jgi:hypothetical protein